MNMTNSNQDPNNDQIDIPHENRAIIDKVKQV